MPSITVNARNRVVGYSVSCRMFSSILPVPAIENVFRQCWCPWGQNCSQNKVQASEPSESGRHQLPLFVLLTPFPNPCRQVPGSPSACCPPNMPCLFLSQLWFGSAPPPLLNPPMSLLVPNQVCVSSYVFIIVIMVSASFLSIAISPIIIKTMESTKIVKNLPSYYPESHHC